MSRNKSLRGKIKFAELSNTGMVREHNEDAIGLNDDMGLLVLADGMGGYNAGEVASGIAVQTITDLAAEGATREERNDVDPHTGLMRQTIVLRDAVARANKIIFQTAQSLSPAGRAVRAADHGPLSVAGTGRPRLLFRRRGAAVN